MDGHVRILGWLYLAMGVLSVLTGIAIALIAAVAVPMFVAYPVISDGAIVESSAQWHSLALLIGGVVLGVVALTSLPNLLAGWGLLGRRTWARALTICLSVLHLFNFPIGTALGVYGLWVLMNAEADAVFRPVYYE